MPRTVTKSVFQYDELSEEAQEAAREWFKGLIDSSDYSDVIDEAVRAGAMLGIDFKRVNNRSTSGKEWTTPAIWWSVSHSQGDGACFEGRYSYAKGAAAALAKEFGEEFEPTKIAVALQELQRANGYKLTARVVHSDRAYTHEYTTDITVEKAFDEWSEVEEETAKALGELMHRFMRWIYKALLDEDEHLYSEDTIADNIRANEYEFEADGTRTRD